MHLFVKENGIEKGRNSCASNILGSNFQESFDRK